MSYKFAFFNVKGGVGKTSSAITIAHMLSTKARTLLIDGDGQGDASKFYDRFGVAYPTIGDVLTHKISLKKAICETEFENLDIIPSYFTLDKVQFDLIEVDKNGKINFKLTELQKQIGEIENNYEYIVFDLAPMAESLINTNLLAVCDFVFVPLKADKWASDGLNTSINLIRNLKTINPMLKIGGAFLVENEKRNVNDYQLYNLRNDLGDLMWDITIRKNKAIPEMTYELQPLLLYDPRNKATKDYEMITERIIAIFKERFGR